MLLTRYRNTDDHFRITAADLDPGLDFLAELAHHRAMLAEAKGKLGIFSEHAVSETRDLWWSVFSKGRGVAKRSSLWDMLWIGMSSGRDESIIATALRVLLNVLINFSLALIGAVVAVRFSEILMKSPHHNAT